MPRDERFSARDKKTHKMTRDGLVERNETTGEEQRVSQRGQDFMLREVSAETSGGFASLRRDATRGREPVPPACPPPASGGIKDTRSRTQPDQTDTSRSLWDTARPNTKDSKSSSKAQRRFAEQERSAAEAPTEGPNSSNAPTEPASRSGIPISDPAPHRADIPRTMRGADSSDPPTNTTFTVTHSRLQFSEGKPQAERSSTSKQHDTQYAQKFTDSRAGMEPETSAPSGSSASSQAGEPQKPTNPKLQFSSDELPPEALGKKLTDARRKSERLDGKLDKAREKLPTHRRIRVNKTADPDTGKPMRRLQFEKEVKTRRQHLKGPVPLRPVKAAGNTAVGYGHKKMFEVEDENVATKAAHRTEMVAEGAARSAYRFHKTRPYRKVSRLQQKSAKAGANLAYQQALHDNPQLKKNMLARMWQKQKIKRQYAKAAREAKRAGTAVKTAGEAASRAAAAVAGFIRRHPMAVGIAALLLLMVFVIMTMFSSCANMAGGGFSAILMSSYTAADADIDSAELAYREWETDLQSQIDNAESNHPGFDEYRFDVDEISHAPYLLMAYLTAKHGDFTFADVEVDLLEIFAEQYTLEFTEEVETRYNDPNDSDEDGDREPYDWHILNIALTVSPFADVIADRLDEEQQEHIDLLMDSGGNRQYAGSPFPFDWRPYISCYYGWRVHPITGAKDNHQAIDIAVAEGTAILAAHDGIVTISTLHSAYGYYVAIDDGNGLVTKYAHCSQLLVDVGRAVKQGDVIALVGSTGDSTGPHLHYEVIKNGIYLNPLYFAHSGE